MYCIDKLCKLLDKNNMKYKRHFILGGGEQIILLDEKNEKIDDAIYIEGVSHGYQDNLLETLVLNCCNGYETPEEILEGWKTMLKT